MKEKEIFTPEQIRELYNKPIDPDTYAHNRMRALHHVSSAGILVRDVMDRTHGRGQNFRPHNTNGEADIRMGMNFYSGVEHVARSLEADLGLDDAFFEDDNNFPPNTSSDKENQK